MKRIEEVKKAVELTNRCKREHPSDKEKMELQLSPGFQLPQFTGNFGFPPPLPFMPPLSPTTTVFVSSRPNSQGI